MYELMFDSECYDLCLDKGRDPSVTFGAAAEWEIVTLSSLLCRVEKENNVTFKRFGRMDTVAGNGKVCTEQFSKLITKYNPKLVSYNGGGYDIPVIINNALRYGVSLAPLFKRGTKFENYTHRYASNWHADLLDLSTRYRAAKPISLGALSALVGLPGKIVSSGDQVRGLVESENYEVIKQYCEADVLLLAGVWLRWSKMVGDLCDTGFRKSAESYKNFIDREALEHEHYALFRDMVNWGAFFMESDSKTFLETLADDASSYLEVPNGP